MKCKRHFSKRISYTRHDPNNNNVSIDCSQLAQIEIVRPVRSTHQPLFNKHKAPKKVTRSTNLNQSSFLDNILDETASRSDRYGSELYLNQSNDYDRLHQLDSSNAFLLNNDEHQHEEDSDESEEDMRAYEEALKPMATVSLQVDQKQRDQVLPDDAPLKRDDASDAESIEEQGGGEINFDRVRDAIDAILDRNGPNHKHDSVFNLKYPFEATLGSRKKSDSQLNASLSDIYLREFDDRRQQQLRVKKDLLRTNCELNS